MFNRIVVVSVLLFLSASLWGAQEFYYKFDQTYSSTHSCSGTFGCLGNSQSVPNQTTSYRTININDFDRMLSSIFLSVSINSSICTESSFTVSVISPESTTKTLSWVSTTNNVHRYDLSAANQTAFNAEKAEGNWQIKIVSTCNAIVLPTSTWSTKLTPANAIRIEDNKASGVKKYGSLFVDNLNPDFNINDGACRGCKTTGDGRIGLNPAAHTAIGVPVASSFFANYDFTVGFWVGPYSGGTGVQPLIESFYGELNTVKFGVYLTGSGATKYINVKLNNTSLTLMPVPIYTNRYSHVVISVDRNYPTSGITTIKVYVDNIEVAGTATNNITSTSSHNTYLGAGYNGGSTAYHYFGYMDNAFLETGVLTAAQRESYYNYCANTYASVCKRTFLCNSRPSGTDWNNVDRYEQKYYDVIGWLPPDSTTVYNTTASSTSCRYKCATNYSWNGSVCVANTKTFGCAAKPGGDTTAWNTVSSYTQTWNGTAWSPADSTTTYNATASTTSCRYKCAENYTWNGSVCVADTRTDQTCTGLPPSNASWNTVSSITQTWSGTEWLPTTVGSYNTVSSTTECRFKCATNYTWNSSTSQCDPSTRIANCTGLKFNASWNTAASITQTWSGTEWLPTTVGAYNEEPSTTECRWRCNLNYHLGTDQWGNPACLADTREYNCPEKAPGASEWNTVSGYTQTWNGSSWMPLDTVTEYNETPSTTQCHFKCSAGYEFKQNGEEIWGCWDINECEPRLDPVLNEYITIHECNKENMECNNTTGNYECKCLDGYARLYDSDQNGADDLYYYSPGNPLFVESDLFDLDINGYMDSARGKDVAKLIFCAQPVQTNGKSLFEDIFEEPWWNSDRSYIEGIAEDFCDRTYFNGAIGENTIAVRFLMKFLNGAISNLIIDGGASEGAAVRNRQLIDSYILANSTNLIKARNFATGWDYGTRKEGICLERLTVACSPVSPNPEECLDRLTVECSLEDLNAYELSSVGVVVIPDSETTFDIPAECESGCDTDFIFNSGRTCVDRDLVSFDDGNFFNCVLDHVQSLDMTGADDNYVTSDEMAALSYLDCSSPAQGNEIKSVRGIEYAVNAQEIYLSGNRITDLYPIGEISRLRKTGASKRIAVCDDDGFKVKIYSLSKKFSGNIPQYHDLVELTPRAFYRNETDGAREILFNKDGIRGFCISDENCESGYYCDTEKNRCIESCNADDDCSNEYAYCDTNSSKCISDCNSVPCRDGYECNLSLTEPRCEIKKEYRVLSESIPHFFNCLGYATYVEIEDTNPATPQFAFYCHENIEGSYVLPQIESFPVTSRRELEFIAPDGISCQSGTVFDIYTTDYQNNSRVNEDAEIMIIEDEIRMIDDQEYIIKASARTEMIPDRNLAVRYIVNCSGLTGCPSSNPELCGGCSKIYDRYVDQKDVAETFCGPDRYALMISYTGIDTEQESLLYDEEGINHRIYCINESTGEIPTVEISETGTVGVDHKVIVIPRYIKSGVIDTLDISNNGSTVPVTVNGETYCPSILEFSSLSYLTSLEYLNISSNWYNSYNGSSCVFQPRSGFPFLSPLENLKWLDISGTGIGNDPGEDNDNAISGNIYNPEDYLKYRRSGTRAIGDIDRLHTLKMANNGMSYINPRLSTRFEKCQCEDKLSFEEFRSAQSNDYFGSISLTGTKQAEDTMKGNSIFNYVEIKIPDNSTFWNDPVNSCSDINTIVRVKNASLSVSVFEKCEPGVDQGCHSLSGETYRLYTLSLATLFCPMDNFVTLNDLFVSGNDNFSLVNYSSIDGYRTDLSFYKNIEDGNNQKTAADKKIIKFTRSNLAGRKISFKFSAIIEDGHRTDVSVVKGAARSFVQFGESTGCDTVPFAIEDINEDEVIDYADIQDKCACDPFKGVCYGTKMTNPSLFETLGNLQYLDVSVNTLTENTIHELKNGALQEATVKKLDGVDRLVNLRGLYARYTGLEVELVNINSKNDIKQISDLTDLSLLDLSGNSIRYVSAYDYTINLPSGSIVFRYISPFEKLRKLKEVVLSGNNMAASESLKVLENAPGLKYLDVSGNNLVLPDFIYRLNALEYLDASDNDIVISNMNSMPFNGSLPKLKYLDLKDNSITQVFWLSKAPFVEEIDLSGNTVKNVYAMGNLKNLKAVDISDNCISDTSPVSFVPGAVVTPQNSACFEINGDAVCGDGVIQRSDCTGYENCVEVAGAAEECDGNYIFCTELNTEYGYGKAWCNRTCDDYDELTCYSNDDDTMPDDDETADDEFCKNGQIVNTICICNYGYTLFGNICVKKESFVERGESAKTIAGSSGATSGSNTGWGETVDADEINDEDIMNPETIEYIHGCPVPTVENCFSEVYTRDKCGILHRETCNDIQRFCTYRGNQCCIPESTADNANCHPKYNGYCTEENGICTRKTETPSGDEFFGCYATVGGDCVSSSPSCTEEIGDPCESDADCGCNNSTGQCEFKCKRRFGLNQKTNSYEKVKFCVAVRCSGKATIPDFCAKWKPKEGEGDPRELCVPKPVKDFFVFPYNDFDDMKDIRYEDGNFYDQTRLPEPTFIGRSSFSSYLTWAQQRQASIHNIIRPVDKKFADLIDSARNPNVFGTECASGSLCIEGDGDRSAGYDNAFSRDRSGKPDSPDDAGTLSEEAMFRAGCLVYGCDDKIDTYFGPEGYFTQMSLQYGLPLPEFIFAPEPGCAVPSSGQVDSATIRACLSAEGAVIGRFGRDSMTFDSRIDSCEEFVYQKFYDYNRFVDIASVYEREPFRIVSKTFDLDSFSNGCSPTSAEKMGGLSWESTFSLCESGKLYSANVFWEAVKGIAGNTGPFSTVDPHISNGVAFNGTYGIPFSTSIINSSSSKVCEWPDNSGGMNSSFTCSSGIPKGFSSYQSAVNGANIAQLDRGYMFVRSLKEQLLYLLLSRANIETLWNEKREEALKVYPEDKVHYKVPVITEKTRDVLSKLSIYNDVRWIDTVSDITDPVLVAKIDNEEIETSDAIDQARIKKFEELHRKLDFDIRTTKFDLTGNAKKLWGDDHYGNTRYLMNEFSSDMRNTRESFYPGDETKYLIEDTLAEIDRRIGELLDMANAQSVNFGAETIALDCFGTNGNAACNLDPEEFVREMSSLISPKILEANYKKCESVTNNSDEMFKTVENAAPILENHMRLEIPAVSESEWQDLVDAMNCCLGDSDCPSGYCGSDGACVNDATPCTSGTCSSGYTCVNDHCKPDNITFYDCNLAVSDLESFIKDYKKNLLSKEHFDFGGNIFDIVSESSDVFGKTAWGFAYEDSFEEKLEDLAYGDYTNTIYHFCYDLAVSSVDILGEPESASYYRWQCFDSYLDVMPVYQAELMSFKQRISAIEKGYELKKAQIAARKLKTAGMFDPKGAGQNEIQKQTGDDPDKEPTAKNPLNIPTSMEKWFSDYRQFGVDDLNAYYNFITGFGVKDFILDFNKFNPLPYLKDVDAFMPHIARAIYKNNFPGVYEEAMTSDDPNKRENLELDIQKISIWMKNNLENMKMIEDGFRETISLMKGFSMNKFSQMAKGALPTFDTEKILDAVAKEATRELMLNIARQSGNANADPGKLEETFKILLSAKDKALNMDISDTGDLEDYRERQQVISDIIGRFEKDMQFNAGVIRTKVNELKGTETNPGLVDIIKGFIEGTMSGNPFSIATELLKDKIKGLVYVSFMDGTADLDEMEKFLTSPIFMDTSLPTECVNDETFDEKEKCRNVLVRMIRSNPSVAEAKINTYVNYENYTNIGLFNYFIKNHVITFQSVLRNAAHQSIYDYIVSNLNVPEDQMALIYAIDKKIRNKILPVRFNLNGSISYDSGFDLPFRKVVEAELERCYPYDEEGPPATCEANLNTMVETYLTGIPEYDDLDPDPKNAIRDTLKKIYIAKQQYVNGIKKMVELTNSSNKEKLNKYFVILNNEVGMPKIQFDLLGGIDFEASIKERIIKYVSDVGNEFFGLLTNGGDFNKIINEISKFSPDKSTGVDTTLVLPDFSSILNAVNKKQTDINVLEWNSTFTEITQPEYNNIKILVNDSFGKFNNINTMMSATGGTSFISNLNSSIFALSGSTSSLSVVAATAVRYPEFRFNNLRAGLQESLDSILLIGESFKNSFTGITELFNFSAIEELRIPVIPVDAIEGLQDENTDTQAFTKLKALKNKLTTVDPVKEFGIDLSQIQVSDDFLPRVITRLFQDSMRFDKLKQLFSAASSGNVVEILTVMKPDQDEFNELQLYLKTEKPNITEFEYFLRGDNNSTKVPALLDIMVGALILRAEEIVTRELFKAPYAEAAAHASSGLTLFGLDVKLFEATFYITSRLQRDEFGHIVDMERVNSKSREKFMKDYDDKIVRFQPYQKYFFVGAVTSLDDLKDAAIAVGQNLAEEGIAEAQKYIDKQLEKLNDLEDEEGFGQMTQDPELTDYKLAEIEEGGTVNFQIGPVPAYVNFGFALRCGIRTGYDLNYGWTQGFTIGASAGPYLVVGAYVDAGVGFDYTWVAIQIGIGGQIDVFDFYAPFKAQAMLKPELGMDGIQVNFYLRSSLSPVLSLLSGKIYMKAVGRVGKCPLCLGFDFKKTIFEFKPLIKLEFGNIIPIKPLKFNLLTIGEGVKLMGKEL